MADITIVNGVYKPTYNWGGTTLYHNQTDQSSGSLMVPNLPSQTTLPDFTSQTCGDFGNFGNYGTLWLCQNSY